ncbi:hypothetical protein NQZ68_013580 [Dissostichus eleginoides]|nr:hypothetical protein NQZ68_013580 [Dissostichus eleginoides]
MASGTQSLLLILEKGRPPLRAAVLDVLLSRSLTPGNQAFIPSLCSDKKATDRNTLSSPGIASLLLTSLRFRGLQSVLSSSPEEAALTLHDRTRRVNRLGYSEGLRTASPLAH